MFPCRMAELEAIVAYCAERLRVREIQDFEGASNGLQVQNAGKVTKIGAGVDANEATIHLAAEAGCDLLLVHHGLYWSPPWPVTGINYDKLHTLLIRGMALYSAHLPLDAHPELGNNAGVAQALGLRPCGGFAEYEGTEIGLVAEFSGARMELRERLSKAFVRIAAMEFGSEGPRRVAILTGSGASVLELLPEGVDTLITGEVKQHHFTVAQERRLNLYCCGHYATEVFGVKALAAELAERFAVGWTFLDTACPL